MKPLITFILFLLLLWMMSSCIVQRVTSRNELHFSYLKIDDSFCKTSPSVVSFTPQSMTTNYIVFTFESDTVRFTVDLESVGNKYIGDNCEVRFLYEFDSLLFNRPVSVEIKRFNQFILVSKENICLTK